MSDEDRRESGVLKEIDEMIDINLDAPQTEPPTTEQPSEGAQTDPPQTEPPVGEGEEHETEPPTTEEPEKQPETSPPATEPPVDYMEEIRRLRGEIEELRGGKKPPATSPPATSPPLEDIDFIGDEDPDDIVRDKSALNKLLNAVHKRGVETGVQRSQEGVLRKIPDLVKRNVELSVSLKKASENFYKNNKDLVPFKKVCATVFEELVSEHPDWTYEKSLEETGKEARKRLELINKPPVKGKERVNPTFPRRSKGSRGRQQVKGKTKTDSLLKEIDEMNKV